MHAHTHKIQSWYYQFCISLGIQCPLGALLIFLSVIIIIQLLLLLAALLYSKADLCPQQGLGLTPPSHSKLDIHNQVYSNFFHSTLNVSTQYLSVVYNPHCFFATLQHSASINLCSCYKIYSQARRFPSGNTLVHSRTVQGDTSILICNVVYVSSL